MLCGKLPFYGKTAERTRELIVKAEPDFPYHISPEVRQLISGMLRPEGPKRLTMDQVVAHPWVSGKEKQPEESSKEPKRARRKSISSGFKSFKPFSFLSSGLGSDDKLGEDKETTVEEAAEKKSREAKNSKKKRWSFALLGKAPKETEEFVLEEETEKESEGESSGSASGSSSGSKDLNKGKNKGKEKLKLSKGKRGIRKRRGSKVALEEIVEEGYESGGATPPTSSSATPDAFADFQYKFSTPGPSRKLTM